VANLTFVPSTTGSSVNPTLTLDEIPQDVRDEVEQVYKILKDNIGRMHVEFESDGELKKYITYVTTYCKIRPAGELRFRKSPKRNAKPGEMEFRITDLETPNEKTTEEIRETVEKVKATAK
jgi:hypothetical protein